MIGSDALGSNSIGNSSTSGAGVSAIILNRDKPHYRQQPPGGIPARRDGIGKGLVFAAAIAYEAVEHLGGDGAWGTFTAPNTNAPTYSKTIGLGKTVVFDETNNTPLQSANMGGFPLPLTVMVTFNANTWAGAQPCLIGIGSGGTSGGWRVGVDATTVTFSLAGVANYALTVTPSLSLNTDYVLVVTVTGDGGNVQAWVKQLTSSSAAVSTSTPTAVGTMNTTFQYPLTLGAGDNAGSFVDPGGAHVGSFAIWNRALPTSELYKVLENPFRLWVIPERGRFAISGTTTSASGTAAGAASGSGIGAATDSSVGSSTGVGTVSGIGSSTANSPGTSSGTATVTGVGASTDTTVGTANGSATGSASGSAQYRGVGSATGSASGSAVSNNSATGVGSATGSATVSGVGTGQISAVGSASGAETVTGYGVAYFYARGTGTGSASGSAVGIATWRSAGSAVGQALGNAVSRNTRGAGSAAGLAVVSGKGYGFKPFRVIAIDATNRSFSVEAVPARVVKFDSVPVRIVYFEYD